MIPPQLQNLIAELKKELQAALGEIFVQLILFGSYARGDYSSDSDLDFILLSRDKLSKDEEEMVNVISARLSLKYDTVIVCFDYWADDFEKGSSTLIRNVKQEGIRV